MAGGLPRSRCGGWATATSASSRGDGERKCWYVGICTLVGCIVGHAFTCHGQRVRRARPKAPQVSFAVVRQAKHGRMLAASASWTAVAQGTWQEDRYDANCPAGALVVSIR